MLGIVSLLLFRSVLPFLGKKRSFDLSEKLSFILSIGVAVIMVGLYWAQGDKVLLLYPAVMSLAVAGMFSFTLVYPPSIIERFARLTNPHLSELGIRYTRKITVIWVAFCLVNALISLGTVLVNDRKLWMLYNGCISYILMGLLMGAEYIARLHFKAKHNN